MKNGEEEQKDEEEEDDQEGGEPETQGIFTLQPINFAYYFLMHLSYHNNFFR